MYGYKPKKSLGKRIIISSISLLIPLCLVLPVNNMVQAADATLREKYNIPENTQKYYYDSDNEYYNDYIRKYINRYENPAADRQIILDISSITASDKGDIPVSQGLDKRIGPALLWDEKYEWFEWSFNIDEEGLYEIDIEYCPLPGSSADVQRSILLDGKLPFVEADNIMFYRMWTDEGEPRVNSQGDEINPMQKEVPEWRTARVSDSRGFYSDPLKFYLSRGRHVLRLKYIDQPAAFGRIILKTPPHIITYDEIMNIYKQKGYPDTDTTCKFQAESSEVLKNDMTIRREWDANPVTEPVSIEKRKLNVIGGWRWRKGNQSISWEFEVPEDGLYKIGMRILNTWNEGLPSYRQVEIDGDVPFQEMKEYKFEYNKKGWVIKTLEDSKGKPYLFYLKKGKHKIAMTVKMGPVTDVINSLKKTSVMLSDILQEIIMITGSDSDPNYVYDIEEKMPKLKGNLKTLSDRIQSGIDILNNISSKRPTIVNSLVLLQNQLMEMMKNIENIPRKMNDLKNAQDTMGTAILNLQEQPLYIDYFMAGPSGAVWKTATPSLFDMIRISWRNFINSFKNDYNKINGINDENKYDKVINVWMARGKEWCEIVKQLADEDFTPKTGIAVNMNMTPASQLNSGSANVLLLSLSSGNAPDVACAISSASPVEFAIRGAACNIEKFEDYDEIAKRFLPNIMTPLKYNNGVYGLPETMNFKVLFYRKDIIRKLGIMIPDTWEDLYNYVLPALYINNLQFYYQSGDISPFLFQMGANFYNKKGTKSALDTPEAYTAFKELTQIHTSYGVPIAANFYNRMRSGEMPMGISDYSTYIMLSVAAPELEGKWAIAPIPGRKKSDGTVDRSIGGVAGESAVIFSKKGMEKESWEFLKWWTSREVQERFGKEAESLIGLEARWNSANKEAFLSLPWDREHIEVIKKQWEWYKEQPVVLGGYFTNRHITNAWNRIVLENMNIRDSLEQAVRDINRELESKQVEYGFKVKN